MKRVVIFFIIASSFLSAGLFDFLDNNKINSSYKDGDYAQTISLLYQKDDSEIVNYNLANSYYKLKNYKKALKYYKRAMGRGVDEHNRLYNIGNCYFRLQEYKKAAYAYKKALEIRKDKDTINNLKLVINKLKHHKLEKKLKKEKDQKKKQKEKQKKNSKRKSNKLTKSELEKLKKQLEKEKLRNELKKELKSSFKNKKVPIIMYKIKDKSDNSIINPW